MKTAIKSNERKNLGNPRSAAYTSIDANNPWPGLDCYTEDAAHLFNGRKKESLDLLWRIQNHPLTILFGKSGLGKTSLLQAGLFPKLRVNKIYPIYIRLDFSNNADSLISQVVQAFKSEITGGKIEAPKFKPNETLWEYLHRNDLTFWNKHNWPITPLLVFDQFEEIHTLATPSSAEAVHHFKVFLADLIENRIPADLNRQLETGDIEFDELSFRSQRLKILLSFREDFLANFENWKKQIPSLIHNRTRLEPMNHRQAIDAVFESGKSSRLLSKETSEKIVQMVEQNSTCIKPSGYDQDNETMALVSNATIEPTILCLICQGLNEMRQRSKKDTIDASLLNTKKGQAKVIIEDFYNRALSDLEDSNHIKKFIEDELITTLGYRNRCSRDDAIGKGIKEDILRELENRRLLHQIVKNGVIWYELSHDLLTNVVIRGRDKRIQIEEKRLYEDEITTREQKKLLEEEAKSAAFFQQLAQTNIVKARQLKIFVVILLFALSITAYKINQAHVANKLAVEKTIKANIAARLARERQTVAEELRILIEVEKDLAETRLRQLTQQR
ncbi:MAG: hypothetical protein ACC707_07670 [Thiohalomonadales bacterium]